MAPSLRRGAREGETMQDTLQVRPCKLDGALLVCAVLRTRQDRGWASCPTRPRHASRPWRQRSCIAYPPARFRVGREREGCGKAGAKTKAPCGAFVFKPLEWCFSPWRRWPRPWRRIPGCSGSARPRRCGRCRRRRCRTRRAGARPVRGSGRSTRTFPPAR